MPTVVFFSGLDGDCITVEETSEQLLHIWSEGDGLPLCLTRDVGAGDVYINRSRIACWYPAAVAERPALKVRHFSGPI
jgi:hypothetical protein